MRGKLLAAGAAAVLAIAAAVPAHGQGIEIKLAHSSEPGSIFQVSADEFAKRANAKLAGKAKVTVYGSAQLGADKELLQKLKLGTVEISLPSSIMSSESDVFGVFDMPYLVKDRAHMQRIEREVFWPAIAPTVDAKGLKVIAVWENGFRHITNNRRPINVPDDLKGIKLRVPEGKWRVKMFQAYGANPTPMKFSELFTALQTGVVDGQENPFANIVSAKFYEVQKYLSLTNHLYTPAYVTVGTKKWAALPTDVRQVLEETARDVQPFVYATAEKWDTDLLDKLRTSGIQINQANREAFVSASRPIYEEFSRDVAGAKALIDKSLALAK
jgi:tripartite ATP-independent transporter DctP family solute receptor